VIYTGGYVEAKNGVQQIVCLLTKGLSTFRLGSNQKQFVPEWRWRML